MLRQLPAVLTIIVFAAFFHVRKVNGRSLPEEPLEKSAVNSENTSGSTANPQNFVEKLEDSTNLNPLFEISPIKKYYDSKREYFYRYICPTPGCIRFQLIGLAISVAVGLLCLLILYIYELRNRDANSSSDEDSIASSDRAVDDDGPSVIVVGDASDSGGHDSNYLADQESSQASHDSLSTYNTASSGQGYYDAV